MKKNIWCNLNIFALTLLIIAAASASLQAQPMTLPVDLSYLSQRADVIVQGKVTEVKEESLPGTPNFQTIVVTLQVENMLRGPAKTTTYTFREAVFNRKAAMNSGKRGYQIGQRMLLFLPSPSARGLSSPIGFEQGRFHINRTAGGSETIANELGNAGLFKNVAQKASKAGKNLTPEQLRVASNKRGPVQLRDFTSLVKSLTSLPRIR
jgi:hypothetical protein